MVFSHVLQRSDIYMIDSITIMQMPDKTLIIVVVASQHGIRFAEQLCQINDIQRIQTRIAANHFDVIDYRMVMDKHLSCCGPHIQIVFC